MKLLLNLRFRVLSGFVNAVSESSLISPKHPASGTPTRPCPISHPTALGEGSGTHDPGREERAKPSWGRRGP